MNKAPSLPASSISATDVSASKKTSNTNFFPAICVKIETATTGRQSSEQLMHKASDEKSSESIAAPSATIEQHNSASDLHEIVVDECSISTPTDSSSIHNNFQEPSNKWLKMDASMVEDALEETWLKLDKVILKDSDKTVIQNGQRLNDRHINFAQVMLRRQFPHLEELKLTLLQEKSQKKIQNGFQIIFCSSRKHWIVTSTIACMQ